MIDQRLKQLKEEVLPLYPFLLTVPTDVPFRLGSRFVNNWAVEEGPFSPEEQQLQYVTFLTHHEGDSLLVAVGDWSDETGSVTMDQPSRPQSATSTQSSGLTKKRISLNDYKNKRQSGSSNLPASQEVARRDACMLLPSDPEHQGLRAHRSENNATRKQIDTMSSPTQTSTRRKHPSEPPDEHTSLPRGIHSETPFKRQRLSPERIPNREPSHSKPNRLPTLLSPTLPPASSSPQLPRLLSPTLPPDIEKELSKPNEEFLAFDTSQTRNFSNSTLAKGHCSKAKPTSHDSTHLGSARNSKPQILRAHSSGRTDKNPSAGLDLMHSTCPEVLRAADSSHQTIVDSHQSMSSKAIMGIDISPNTNFRAGRNASLEKPQLILKLKYGRSNRKRVEALLKFSGKRTVAQRITPAKERDNSGVPQIKKEERTRELKAPVPEKPRNLASVLEPSTSAPQHDRTKRTSTMLVKDYKDPTPYWTELGDGDENASQYTRRDSVTTSKPSPSLTSDQKVRSRDSERRAWKDEFHKFSNLGRELKHAAERHTAKDSVTTTDKKLAVATAIETILCFILAFAADDRSKALARQVGESSNWLSILAYWQVVKKNSTPYPALHSLCHVLGAVSYDAIHALDLERLAISPIPGEHTAVPTPGSDGDTVISDESKKTMKEFLELKNRLPECYKKSQRLWLEGTRGLSENVLANQYPLTWSKRSKNYSERGRQPVKVGDYSGEFYLPLERTSLPVEVVRFGWSMLTEWCTKEDVDWKGRLGL